MASSASRTVLATTTPLPAARPSAFDHDRRALALHIGARVIGVGEALVGAGGNAELGAQRLGEALGAFELGGDLARPERLDAGGGEIIDDAGRQRRLRPDHHELDRIRLAEVDHRGMVGDIERHAFRLPRDAGIAGRAPEVWSPGGGCDLPRQGMFAAAGTEQENVHRGLRMRGLLGGGGRTDRGGAQGKGHEFTSFRARGEAYSLLQFRPIILARAGADRRHGLDFSNGTPIIPFPKLKIESP